MDAHQGCLEIQITKKSAVTSNPLIIQNEERKKKESSRFYSIRNSIETSRTIQRREPYQGNVKCMHFQKVRITIILLFNKMIK